MKATIAQIGLLVLMMLPLGLLAQVKTELYLGASSAPIQSEQRFGLGLEMKVVINQKFETGVYVMGHGRAVSDTFGYSINSPVINVVDFGWINDYNFKQFKRFTLAASLVNGISTIMLGDEAHTSGHFNGVVYISTAQNLTTEYHYIISPGLIVKYNVLEKMNITGKVAYRQLFGNSIMDVSSFNGALYSVGVSLLL